MKVIWLLSLERVLTRYTWEWGPHIPQEILRQSELRGLSAQFVTVSSTFDGFGSPTNNSLAADDKEPDVRVVDVLGKIPEQNASSGAFLNWAATNIWKSTQMESVSRLFFGGLVKPGDVFYITDAWHPGIIQIKYMSELLGIPVKICAQWHAGAHDPWDFLGREIKDKTWVFEFERSIFHAVDCNFFTTNAYIKMFKENLGIGDVYDSKIVRTGYPNSYLFDSLAVYGKPVEEREDIIVFPHRIAPEKQLDIFLDLEKRLPEYKFVVCQNNQLSKSQYHELLGKSKLVFSAALQETYGIAQTEAIVAGAMSMAPNRLSYSEMYNQLFLYPSVWTESYELYEEHRDRLITHIHGMMKGFADIHMQEHIQKQQQYLVDKDYIGGKLIWSNLLD